MSRKTVPALFTVIFWLLLSIYDLDNIDIPYHSVPPDEAWRIGFVRELLDQQHGDVEVPGLLKTELDSILDYLCTQ